MGKAKIGDSVSVHYTGTLEDGSEFDSSRSREPLEFIIGSGQLIPGFDKAVVGLEIGESITVTLPPEVAYGAFRPELVIQVPNDQVPAELSPFVGMKLEVSQANGQMMHTTVTDVSANAITLDANHGLAGKTLIFSIELVEICGG